MKQEQETQNRVREVWARMAAGLAIGAGIGVALGTAMENMGAGIGTVFSRAGNKE